MPASRVDVVQRVDAMGGRDGHVDAADGARALRVPARPEAAHGIIQPLAARLRHEARVDVREDGDGDLAHDATHGGGAHAERGGDVPVLAVARVEPERDGEPATRLDGSPVGRPLAPDGRANKREQEVEGGPGHAKL